ncbi:hypothetical protein GCM10028820_31300 [Tessaracoccus terricola]
MPMVGIARRTVLRGAAVAAVLPLAAGVASASSRDSRGEAGERRALEEAVGSSIRITGVGAAITATVAGVRDLRHAPAGHPHAFSADFELDGEDTTMLELGLVDIQLPGHRLGGVGLLVVGGPENPMARLLVDRRAIAEHPTTIRA